MVIAEVMLLNENFCGFNLAENYLGNDATIAISRILESTSHIVMLNLSTNNITHEGSIPLFEALIKNNSLIELDLSSSTADGKYRNRIQAKGVAPLVNVLR